MRPNCALWTLIKDDASYELTRACGCDCAAAAIVRMHTEEQRRRTINVRVMCVAIATVSSSLPCCFLAHYKRASSPLLLLAARRPDPDRDYATDLPVLYLLDTAQVLRSVPLQHHPHVRVDVDAESRDQPIRRALP